MSLIFFYFQAKHQHFHFIIISIFFPSRNDAFLTVLKHKEPSRSDLTGKNRVWCSVLWTFLVLPFINVISQWIKYLLLELSSLSQTVLLGDANLSSKNTRFRTSLVAQWLRIHLLMQGTWVRALVREDPTCSGAPKPVHHNYWACALESMLRNKRSHNNNKPAHCKEE